MSSLSQEVDAANVAATATAAAAALGTIYILRKHLTRESKIPKCVQKCPKVSESVQKGLKVSNSVQKCPTVSKRIQRIQKGVQKCPKVSKSVQQCTEVRFASLLSGVFTTMAVINQLEKKLANRTSVQCFLSKIILAAIS